MFFVAASGFGQGVVLREVGLDGFVSGDTFGVVGVGFGQGAMLREGGLDGSGASGPVWTAILGLRRAVLDSAYSTPRTPSQI